MLLFLNLNLLTITRIMYCFRILKQNPGYADSWCCLITDLIVCTLHRYWQALVKNYSLHVFVSSSWPYVDWVDDLHAKGDDPFVTYWLAGPNVICYITDIELLKYLQLKVFSFFNTFERILCFRWTSLNII